MITGKVRFSYANVWEAKAPVEGAQPKFSVSLIIPKSDTATLAKIDKALKAAYEEGLPCVGNAQDWFTFDNCVG